MAPEQDLFGTRLTDAQTTLAFLKKEDWFNALETQLNNTEVEVYKKALVTAGQGIGDCMDDRPSLTQDKLIGMKEMVARSLEAPKPSFVGGAAGWVFQFMMAGQHLVQAVESTKALYTQMQWGEMQIHIDDQHGKLDASQLSSRETGCGFLNVINHVAQIVEDLGLGKKHTDIKQLDGIEIFRTLKANGAKIVPLTGNHAQNAKVVVNDVPNQTYPKDAQFSSPYPAFVWDKWATANDSVMRCFNRIAGTAYKPDYLSKIQTAMHLGTGLMLGVVKLGQQGNVMMIK